MQPKLVSTGEAQCGRWSARVVPRGGGRETLRAGDDDTATYWGGGSKVERPQASACAPPALRCESHLLVGSQVSSARVQGFDLPSHRSRTSDLRIHRGLAMLLVL